MKQYDVKCPICGTVNKGLYLEETNGWMECEHCHSETQDLAFLRTRPVKKIPLFDMKTLAQLSSREAV